MDLFGMQVEADYRQDDFRRRAARARLQRSITTSSTRRRLPGSPAVRRAGALGRHMTRWFRRRVGPIAGRVRLTT